MPGAQSGSSGHDKAEMVAAEKRKTVRRPTSDVTSRATDRRRTEGLPSPLRLAHHERGHQLRGTPVASDIDTAAAARIPTEKEEFRLQQETVFFLSAEHGPLLGS